MCIRFNSWNRMCQRKCKQHEYHGYKILFSLKSQRNCNNFISMVLKEFIQIKHHLICGDFRVELIFSFAHVFFWQWLRNDLLDLSSGIYERSQIVSFRQPKNFIAVFGSSTIAFSWYHSHLIRFQIVCEILEVLLGNNFCVSKIVQI